MNTITVCYSAHRPETVHLTARVMEEHEVIILEEPVHHAFTDLLKGNVDIEEHLLELDVGYPQFTLIQYRLLQQQFAKAKIILQIEPYLEQLQAIQLSFAEGRVPADIVPGTAEHAVYRAERDATAALIAYYEAARGDDFTCILESMNDFSRADAARFVLRDNLWAAKIVDSLIEGKTTYVEAGSIHLMLVKLLSKRLSPSWKLQFYSVDRQAIHSLGRKGTLLGPGDILTLHHIWGNRLQKKKQRLYCAQSLIYAKIVIKDEIAQSPQKLAHTHNELDSITAAKQLSFEECRELFFRIRPLATVEAAEVVLNFVAGRS